MSDTKPPGGAKMNVECVIPILNVKSLAASKRFYEEMLGFKLDWETQTMASVSRDGRAIMLCEGDQGHPGTWVWIGVGEIETLYDECLAKGVKIRRKPTNFRWAYEMQIEDPDGHVLRLGTDPKTDRPFMNPTR